MVDTAIANYQAIKDPLEWVKFTGNAITRAGMHGCQNEHQGVVLAMECMAKRLPPLSLAERYHIIFGKLSMKADAMLADFRTKVGGEHRIITRTPEAAEIELAIKKEKHRFKFTWEEAQAEPFVYNGKAEVVLKQLAQGGKPELKDKYATPRSRMQMLWARVVSDGVRALAPEVVAGYYTPEEIEDDVIDVSHQPVKEPVDVEVLMEQAAQEQRANGSGQAEPTVAPAADAELVDFPPVTAVDSAPPPGTSGPAIETVSVADLNAQRAARKCSDEQQSQIKQKFLDLKLSREQMVTLISQAALFEGAKLADLSVDQASNLIGTLNTLLAARTKADIANQLAATEAKPAESQAANGVKLISKVQVDQINTLVSDLTKHDPDLKAKIGKIVQQLGKQSLDQITSDQAEAIKTKLFAKAAQFEGGKGKN